MSGGLHARRPSRRPNPNVGPVTVYSHGGDKPLCSLQLVDWGFRAYYL
jgi:hypothetical protein